jgi:transcriptional regulator with XRE-family HTH domain
MGIVINSELLRREVARRGWTGNKLARSAGVSASTVSAALGGRRITPVSLKQIITALEKAPPIEGLDAFLMVPPTAGHQQVPGSRESI